MLKEGVLRDLPNEEREALQREGTAFHEAGHAVMTLCLGGIINHEGVEISPRWYTGCRFRFRKDGAHQQSAVGTNRRSD